MTSVYLFVLSQHAVTPTLSIIGPPSPRYRRIVSGPRLRTGYKIGKEFVGGWEHDARADCEEAKS